MGGGPWAIFDKDADNVLVFSALDEFMITSPVFDKSKSRICHGVMATVEKIPKLYTFRSILYHGKNGLNEVPFHYQITILQICTCIETSFTVQGLVAGFSILGRASSSVPRQNIRVPRFGPHPQLPGVLDGRWCILFL